MTDHVSRAVAVGHPERDLRILFMQIQKEVRAVPAGETRQKRACTAGLCHGTNACGGVVRKCDSHIRAEFARVFVQTFECSEVGRDRLAQRQYADYAQIDALFLSQTLSAGDQMTTGMLRCNADKDTVF